MNTLEIWISEHQEQDTILIAAERFPELETIAKRENCPIVIIGEITGTGKIEVYHQQEKVVDLELEPILGKEIPQKSYQLEDDYIHYDSTRFPNLNQSFKKILEDLWDDISIGSKRFLTNKVDRSVTGLIVQQQCVGPWQTPLADYGLVAQSHFSKTGIASSIGEQPIVGLKDVEKMVELTVGEMLTNLVWVKISDFEDIKCCGNWMWPMKLPGEKTAMYIACKKLSKLLLELGLAIDGGKDSLSMSYHDTKTIKCPRSLVISSYVTVPDINKKVTPEFKQPGNLIGYINLKNSSPQKLKQVFNQVQQLIEENLILAGHDCSDGGLITTISEMAFAGNWGYLLDLENITIESLLEEELGLVMEIKRIEIELVQNIIPDIVILGYILSVDFVEIQINKEIILKEPMTQLRDMWEKRSFELDEQQANVECVKSERNEMLKTFGKRFSFSKSDIQLDLICLEKRPEVYEMHRGITEGPEVYEMHGGITEGPEVYEMHRGITEGPKVALLRDEGSNGDREMASALYLAGFDVIDISINDMVNGQSLDGMQGLVMVGGFSYSDVFGGAKGWAKIIEHRLKNEFEKFRQRSDTFSLGICNGCQLMTHLGWISKHVKLEKNTSGRFESRFSFVRINPSNSIMLKNMAYHKLGVWVAHQEGRFTLDKEINHSLIPMQYIDFDDHATEVYPYNPNGSHHGIAAICSKDGRHLAMMPHPERSIIKWQIPIVDDGLKEYTPWLKMFQNAYQWSIQKNT